jgi:Zn finger protein HypA/HybF involved in hydrogenase expression
MATEKRLIDANEVEDLFYKQVEYGATDLMDAFDDALNDAQTVDAVEVVHGEWSTIEDDYIGLTALKCSKCNQEYWFEDEPPIKIYNFCPNCGADMRDGDGNG